MTQETSVESLFKEHSFEEIESVRDNLASEIEKRTELLKSIVKEKYRDVVETSDAIQSMKINLKKVEMSIGDLDVHISEFYTRVSGRTKQDKSEVTPCFSSNKPSDEEEDLRESMHPEIQFDNKNELIEQLMKTLAEIWEYFDSGDLKTSIKLYNRAMKLIETDITPISSEQEQHIDTIRTSLNRAREIIKNYLWHKIKSAEPNQIGVIVGSEEEDLYKLSLNSSIEFLVEKLFKDISDTSFQAQIRRHQPCSYFNTQTNVVDPDVNDLKPPSGGYVQIPKLISVELSIFLYEVCRVINTIAGFSLTRVSILDSLKVTVEHVITVYVKLIPYVDRLRVDSRRRRALQLHFDLMYLRVLLNTAKSIELIDELDPRISDLTRKYEAMMDTIELYMVSSALHSNVHRNSHSTIRLFGLLIPHLQ